MQLDKKVPDGPIGKVDPRANASGQTPFDMNTVGPSYAELHDQTQERPVIECKQQCTQTIREIALS
jgi:hypothetical protein